MTRRSHILPSSWLWAWHLLNRASGLDVDVRPLSAHERWDIVAAVVPAIVRGRYLRPIRSWLLARAPTWMVLRGLERRIHGWYRVPNSRAAERVRLRFGTWPVEVGDHVQVRGGRLAAIGYTAGTFSEIIYVLPGGEPEEDPKSVEMTMAWAAYDAGRRSG